MLLEMNCQSVTLTRNEEFHNLVDSVANIVFGNVNAIVSNRKIGSTEEVAGAAYVIAD